MLMVSNHTVSLIHVSLTIFSILVLSTGNCSYNNGGCDHVCINQPNGPRCECDKGYTLVDGMCHGEEWVGGMKGEGRGEG